ncbi:hypothetical protein KC351_g83 [Hortaea werneckii]|nr:hypothetical protein KC351_g83 [Hortaea werneckii]
MSEKGDRRAFACQIGLNVLVFHLQLVGVLVVEVATFGDGHGDNVGAKIITHGGIPGAGRGCGRRRRRGEHGGNRPRQHGGCHAWIQCGRRTGVMGAGSLQITLDRESEGQMIKIQFAHLPPHRPAAVTLYHDAVNIRPPAHAGDVRVKSLYMTLLLGD